MYSNIKLILKNRNPSGIIIKYTLNKNLNSVVKYKKFDVELAV